MKKYSDLLRVSQFILLLMLLSACASPAPAAPDFPQFILVTQDPNASPTPTPFQPSELMVTDVPTFTPVPPTPIATQTFTPPPASPTPASVTTAVSTPEASSRTNYIYSSILNCLA